MSRTHSGLELVKICQKNGLKTANGKGDHVKVYGPAGRGYQVIPLHKELATGTDKAICRWLKLIGIVVVVILIGYLLLAVV